MEFDLRLKWNYLERRELTSFRNAKTVNTINWFEKSLNAVMLDKFIFF